jgi:hypothetical protein
LVVNSGKLEGNEIVKDILYTLQVRHLSRKLKSHHCDKSHTDSNLKQ